MQMHSYFIRRYILFAYIWIGGIYHSNMPLSVCCVYLIRDNLNVFLICYCNAKKNIQIFVLLNWNWSHCILLVLLMRFVDGKYVIFGSHLLCWVVVSRSTALSLTTTPHRSISLSNIAFLSIAAAKICFG